ncbi:MAG: hypothetical protein R3D98_16970 [Candidatus Krumholzibacteriia bacterium]
MPALARDYGRTIAGFDAEVVFFDANGHVLASSDPDSLSGSIGEWTPSCWPT